MTATGAQALVVQADVSTSDGAAKLFAETDARFGGVDDPNGLALGDAQVHRERADELERVGVVQQHALVPGDGDERDYLEIAYGGTDTVFTPVEQLSRIARYSGSEQPQLSRLGGGEWRRAKERATRAARERSRARAPRIPRPRRRRAPGSGD